MTPRVISGTVIAYRLFDIAFGIDLPKVETLWARSARLASTRGRLATTPPKAVAFGVPPVALRTAGYALANVVASWSMSCT